MRYPIVYQSDSMLCGITCLQMICKSFGKIFYKAISLLSTKNS
ncbi:cysteine peptidase family C39 domain-containing protein [Hoylesella timonensis]